MNQEFQQWVPVTIIVAGYLLGFFFQNRRLDDLRDLVNKRLDDIKDVLRAEIQSSEAKLTVVLERNHSEANRRIRVHRCSSAANTDVGP